MTSLFLSPGLKKFSDWPTYPQLYVNGELIGGLDIVKEMVEQGEFKDILPKHVSIKGYFCYHIFIR